jgi:hypothetical protein
MTREEEQNFFVAISAFVKEQIAPLRAQIVELQKGLEDFGYVGQWHEGSVYRRGNFVSMSGSMWSCCADATTDRPSTSSADWILAVKRGRDGKHVSAG